jgi:Trypsin
MLGGHDLDKKFEKGRSFITPKRIVIHKDWCAKNAKADADIAMIELQDSVHPNEYVQQVNLWELNVDIPVNSGTIIGYGMSNGTKDSYESVPKKLNVVIHSNEDCFLKYPKLAEFSSKRTFCAGSDQNSGPCLGDSGNGLFVKINGVFYLRGLVSTAVKSFETTCDTSKYAIYTDVLKFKNWIRDYSDDEVNIYENTLYCGSVDHLEISNFDGFPWIARIQNVETSVQKLGVLITNKHVLSSISAVAQWSKILRKWIFVELNNLKVHLGTLVTTVNHPIKINFHQEFNPTKKFQKHSNVYVALRNSVTFTNNVHPICLLAPGFDFSIINDALVYTSATESFGMRSMSITSRDDKINVSNSSLCKNDFLNDTELHNDIICLQGTDNEAFCGNDMPLFIKHNKKWYLRGMALPIETESSNSSCNSVLLENIVSDILLSFN